MEYILDTDLQTYVTDRGLHAGPPGGPTTAQSDGYLRRLTDTSGMDETESELLAAARKAFESAYVPYSEYPVGAALRAADGTIYTGCNVENANYSNSLHAEEVAIGKALSEGVRTFERLAVASAARDGVTPCGMCRQTLAEFCEEEFEIICDTAKKPERYTLGELLPETITAAHLEAAAEKR